MPTQMTWRRRDLFSGDGHFFFSKGEGGLCVYQEVGGGDSYILLAVNFAIFPYPFLFVCFIHI